MGSGGSFGSPTIRLLDARPHRRHVLPGFSRNALRAIGPSSPTKPTTSNGARSWIASSGRATPIRTSSASSVTRRTRSSSTASRFSARGRREHGAPGEEAIAVREGPGLVLAQVEELWPRRRLRAGPQRVRPEAPESATRTVADSRRPDRESRPRHRKLEPYDLILTSFPHFVPRFRDLGHRERVLPDRLRPTCISPTSPETPRSWTSCSSEGSRAALTRRATSCSSALRAGPRSTSGATRRTVGPQTPRFRRRYHGEAWGLDMYGVLAHSKIALNRHIDVAEDNANNMRLYEATGVGTLLADRCKAQPVRAVRAWRGSR